MSLPAYIEFIDSNPPPLHVLVDVMYTLHPNLPSTFRTPFAAFGHAIQYVHDCRIDYLIRGGEAAKTFAYQALLAARCRSEQPDVPIELAYHRICERINQDTAAACGREIARYEDELLLADTWLND
ncbi:hypothetical protein RhiLY_10065 [Ceratobasidium sp. AG-Ba]|nr:hypothetical protein RhiLY_10065 [Ceratobasidium sp. AG-Ba]